MRKREKQPSNPHKGLEHKLAVAKKARHMARNRLTSQQRGAEANLAMIKRLDKRITYREDMVKFHEADIERLGKKVGDLTAKLDKARSKKEAA